MDQHKKELGKSSQVLPILSGRWNDGLQTCATAALEAGEEHAISNAVDAAVARYKDWGNDTIEELLLPGIDWLQKTRTSLLGRRPFYRAWRRFTFSESDGRAGS
jgi:hypothetical protein